MATLKLNRLSRASSVVADSCGGPRWHIPGLLPVAELAVIRGEQGSGKSILALDMALAVARGTLWGGRECRKGKVVYCDARFEQDERVRGYARHRELAPSELDNIRSTSPPDLRSASSVASFIRALSRFGSLSLVVIDPFEISTHHTEAALRHCRMIHDTTGALVLLVSNAPEEAWSSIHGFTDTEIEVTRDSDAGRHAKVVRQRNGLKGVFSFQLAEVESADMWGNATLSLVVKHLPKELAT